MCLMRAFVFLLFFGIVACEQPLSLDAVGSSQGLSSDNNLRIQPHLLTGLDLEENKMTEKSMDESGAWSKLIVAIYDEEDINELVDVLSFLKVYHSHSFLRYSDFSGTHQFVLNLKEGVDASAYVNLLSSDQFRNNIHFVEKDQSYTAPVINEP